MLPRAAEPENCVRSYKVSLCKVGKIISIPETTEFPQFQFGNQKIKIIHG